VIDTIFFDNWNTIVQAPNLMKHGSSTEIFHQYLLGKGIDMPYKVFLEKYIPIARAQERKAREEGHKEPDYRKRLEDVFSELNVSSPIDLSYDVWTTYLEMWIDQTEYFPKVPEMLKVLKQDYKLGVITNYMDGPTCRKIFDKLGYNDIFDSLVVSKEFGYAKPSRVLFDAAMRETNSKAENCIMVGDTYSADVVGGNLAGMKTVLVDVYDNQQEFYQYCTIVIKNINEFSDALYQLNSS
jgi:putative hydrolase of the HAD superfamily